MVVKERTVDATLEFNDDDDNDVEDDAGFTDAFGADCEQVAETRDQRDAPSKQKRTLHMIVSIQCNVQISFQNNMMFIIYHQVSDGS